MDNIKLACFSIFLLINRGLIAQSADTLSARQVIEKGSKGDIILGRENKKDQLKNTPILLGPTDSINKKDVSPASKKYRRKKSKHN